MDTSKSSRLHQAEDALTDLLDGTISPGLSPPPMKEKKSSPLDPTVPLEDVQKKITTESLRRQWVQESFDLGGTLIDIKARVVEKMKKEEGDMEWQKGDDEFLDLCLQGYRVKLHIAPKDVPMTECCVMLVDYPSTDGILCSKGHFICRDALNHFVKEECKKEFEEIYKRKGRIICPVAKIDCDAGPYSDTDLAQKLDRDVFEAYLECVKRCLYQEAFEQVSEKVERLVGKGKVKEAVELDLMEEQVRLQFRKPDGTYGGYKCRDCGFGPIDHMACEDLRAHHQNRVKEGVYINNACPICGWFDPHIRNWPKWDGSFVHFSKDVSAEMIKNRETEAKIMETLKKLRNELKSCGPKLTVIQGALSKCTFNYGVCREWALKMMNKWEDERSNQIIKNLKSVERRIKDTAIFHDSGLPQKIGHMIVQQTNAIRTTKLEERAHAFKEYEACITGAENRIALIKGLYDKMKEVCVYMNKLAVARRKAHDLTVSAIMDIKMKIHVNSKDIREFSYATFMDGFGSSSDEESEEDGDELEDKPGKPAAPLMRPKMSVQESREKVEEARESTESLKKMIVSFEEMELTSLQEMVKLAMEEVDKLSALLKLQQSAENGKEESLLAAIKMTEEFLHTRHKEEVGRMEEKAARLEKMKVVEEEAKDAGSVKTETLSDKAEPEVDDLKSRRRAPSIEKSTS